MATVTVKDYTDQIKKDLQQKSNIFLRLATDSVVQISTPKTPKKSGRLRMDIVKQVLGLKGKIIWGKNYGVYQETKQFKHYTTAGTGPHFAENAVNAMIKLTNTIGRKAGLIK